MIDSDGRLFGRISVVDLFVFAAVLVLATGFLSRQFAGSLETFTAPTIELLITFQANGIMYATASQLEQDDLVFRMHEGQPLGRVTGISMAEATEIMTRSDGSALIATMDERYMLTFDVAALGSITSIGHFINGNDHIGVGSILTIVTSRAQFESEVIRIQRR